VVAEGADVAITWEGVETNETSDVLLARISKDGGSTFGSLLILCMNGSIGETGEEGGGEREECLFISAPVLILICFLFLAETGI
jgi:hypothetical protein